ncbi:carph-isopro domain-containing protein [Acidovorax sp. SUPP950]|uniref:carph-isopro domain-containing protein n=1 Tax=Acidovorax sp. SUPP950 TaxID=511901 RepID=UPI0032EA40C0
MDALHLQLIEALGGTNTVADLAGVKPPSVSGWKEAGRIPDGKLIRLAPIAETRGVSSRKELFPNDWHLIWPELVNGSSEVVGPPSEAAHG